MPTAHRRVNVTCDPQLSAALEATRPLLDAKSDAGQIRALALAGARALSENSPGHAVIAARQELLARGRLRPAISTARSLPWLDELLAEETTTRGSYALAWVRGDE